MTPLAGALIGALIAGGVFAVVLGVLPAPEREARPARWQGLLARARTGITRAVGIRLAIGAAIGIVLFITSGWIAALVAAPAAALFLPVILGKTTAKAPIDKLEALQIWTRGVGGLIAGASSVERAIRESAANTPPLIEAEVDQMISRMDAGWRTTDALQGFADDINDSTADIVVGHLKLNIAQRGSGLSRVLQDVADSMRDEIRSRRKIDADRANTRTTQRIITMMLLVFLTGITLFASIAGTMFGFYQTALGQIVIASLLGLYAAALWWQYRSTLPRGLPRVLAATEAGR